MTKLKNNGHVWTTYLLINNIPLCHKQQHPLFRKKSPLSSVFVCNLPQWATLLLLSRCRVRIVCRDVIWGKRPRAGHRVQHSTWLAAAAFAAYGIQSQSRAMSVGTPWISKWLSIIWLDKRLGKKAYLIKLVTKRLRGKEIVRLVSHVFWYFCVLFVKYWFKKKMLNL